MNLLSFRLARVPAIFLILGQVSVAGPNTEALREDRQRKSLSNAALGYEPLANWQKLVLAEEVYTSPSRYFKSSDQIDHAALKHILKFYGPAYFKIPKPEIIVVIEADPTCTACLDPQIKSLIQTSVERRGFRTTFIPSSEIISDQVLEAGNPAEDQLVQYLQKRGASGGILLQWSTQATDESSDDTGQKSTLLHSFFQIGGMALRLDEKELKDSDSFSFVVRKILTDIWMNLGMRTSIEESIRQAGASKEVLIEINGFQNYFQYARIRANLAASLKNVSHFEERKLARGSATFSCGEDVKPDDIRKEMNELILDPEEPSGKSPLMVNVR